MMGAWIEFNSIIMSYICCDLFQSQGMRVLGVLAQIGVAK